ncbi:MAG: protein-methionine-sulfoxide reductase catalytic subunit MsrP [Planctomycetaceae bacterium]
MQYLVRRPWEVPEHAHTSEAHYRQRRILRREFLQSAGLLGGAAMLAPLAGCSQPTDAEIVAAGKVETSVSLDEFYPAQRRSEYDYGRPETSARAAAEYTNFYEFSYSKAVYGAVGKFRASPWTLTVDGLCAQPREFDVDDLHRLFGLEERAYRHRCVEAWAMCVPWTGFPLSKLLAMVEPQPAAKFVRLETFLRPDEAPQQRKSSQPWPYVEGLTLAEARNELALLATGIFGAPLPKQHGAPVRLVVPWKYGYKGIKSIVRITLTDKQPATFWNTLAPNEYDFPALVDPEVPHPRWSQATEWMLGTREEYPTQKYNGYGDLVGSLYA